MPNGYREFTLLRNNGPLVYRSPATNGYQTVRTRYAVEKFVNGSWYRVANSPLMARAIPSGYSSVRMPALYLQPGNARGYFRMS